MTEELTAQERALVKSWHETDSLEHKLLRLYDEAQASLSLERRDAAMAESCDLIAQRDTALGLCKQREQERDAALARAEADRDDYDRSRKELYRQAVAAESRLAEATALMRRLIDSVNLGGGDMADEMRAFVETAVPASEAEPTEDYRRGYMEGCDDTARELLQGREKEDRLTAAVAALSARLGEHPDAIALRECRAELESVRTTARKLHESLTSAYEDIESARADAEQLRAGHAECRAELEAERQEVELKQAALNTVRAERDTARAEGHMSAGDARLWKLRYDDECKRSEALTSVRALVESIEAEIERDCLPRDSYLAIVEMVRASKGGE